MATYDQIIDYWQSGEKSNLTKADQYDERRTEDAIKKQNALFESAAAFSQKLANKIEADKEFAEEEEASKADKEQIMKKITGHTQLGKPLISEEEKKEYEEGVKTLTEAEKEANRAAGEVLKRGGDQSEATKVKNLSGAQPWRHEDTRAKLLAQNVGDIIEHEMLTNDTLQLSVNGKAFTPKTAETANEKEAAMLAITAGYMANDGGKYYEGVPLARLHNGILNSKGGVYEKILSTHKRLRGAWLDEAAIEQGHKDIAAATKQFDTDKSYVSLMSNIEATTDVKSNPPKGYGRTGAHDKAVSIMKQQMDIGKLNSKQFEDAMEEKVEDPPGSGKEVMIKDKIPTRYAEMKQHMDEAEKKLQEASLENKKVAFNEAQDEIFKKIQEQLKTDASKVTPTYLMGLKAELLQNHDFMGMEPTRLNKYIENQAPGAVEYAIQEGKILELIEKNELTTEKLMQFDVRLIEEHKNKAALIDKLVSPHKAKDVEYLRGLVATKRSTLKFQKGEGNEDAMADYLVGAVYNKALNEAIVAEEKDPSGYARQVAEKWFDEFSANQNNISFRKGFKVPGFNLSSEDLNAKMDEVKQDNKINHRINQVLKEHQDVNSLFTAENVNKVMSKERAQEIITKNLANPDNPEYPAEVSAIYKTQPEGSPITKPFIMEKIAEAHGIEPPPESKTISLAEAFLSKEDILMMEKGDFDQSLRVLSKIGHQNSETDNLNIDFVPHGLGPTVYDEALLGNIKFGDLAGTYELLDANPTYAQSYGLKSTTGEVDWNRVRLATMHINGQVMEGFRMGGDAYKQVFTEVSSRLNQFGKDVMEEAQQTLDYATSEEGMRASQQRQIEMGKMLTGKATAEMISEFLIDRIVDFSKWSSDEINNLVNQIIPDAPMLSEEEKQNVAKARYKYEPTSDNLALLIRPGFYG